MLATLTLRNTLLTVGLSGKTSKEVPEFSNGNRETRSKTNNYLPKLTAAGHHSDSYNVPKHHWSMDVDSWPRIGFPDIYC